MEKYDHKKIEKKWANKWVDDGVFVVDLEKAKDPYYSLLMFPYPSAEGLHIGNFYAFTCTDVFAKYQRLKGKDVFQPIGWDAFGMHLENYALQLGETPQRVYRRTTKNFRKQLVDSGLSLDWTRVVGTPDPEYYKWTQWIFTKLFVMGLAERKDALLNWCPSCKTVLADEQIEGGVCERCKAIPEKKTMNQWFFKITKFAQRLLDGLETMDWSEITKAAQRNWIGRSEGALVKFQIEGSISDNLEVFTTRPDTLFGATFMVMAPEHPLVKQITTSEQEKEVQKYMKQAGAKSNLERTEEKKKTGVFTGGYAINPVNNEKMPIWIADYVLMGYGTGAIMAVPAHDERDFEFAKKYDIPVREVVMPVFGEAHQEAEFRKMVTAVVQRESDGKFLLVRWKKHNWVSPVIGGVDKNETPEQAVEREVLEEAGYKVKAVKRLGSMIESHFFADNKNVWRSRLDQSILVELIDETQGPTKIDREEQERHEIIWLSKEEALQQITHEYNKVGLLRFFDEYVYTGEGVAINSGEFDGLRTKEFKDKIIGWLEEKGLGKGEVNYKLRDWCISRQRYWGPPVPVIYCDKCGVQLVPEKDLPVLLPQLETDWEPTGDGKGPLAKVKEFMEVSCPKCSGPGRREADVMDNFLDSAWYFFRYTSHTDKNKILDQKMAKKWLPVDLYIGGNEHAVLHLMYTRFITMAFRDLGLVDFDNPFKKFRANGMIQKNGKKMSKSRGNVIKPEEYGEHFGYDALKTYLLFLGPLDENRSFSDGGIQGIQRWIDKIYKMRSKVREGFIDDEGVLQILHRTIERVTHDLESLKYNTAIARLMELTNKISSTDKVSAELWKRFIIIFTPFLPSLAEELWHELGNKDSIFNEKWLAWDPELIKEERIELVLQVNGKVRDKIMVAADISEEEAKERALGSEKMKKWLEGKEVRKVIFVKGKLVNVVV